MNRLIDEIARRHHFMGIEGGLTATGGRAGVIPPAWIREGPVYAVFVRAFSEDGNLAGVLKKVPELKELGVKTIWLMPIHPVGVEGRKGKYGSPYAIRDHQRIAGDAGQADDLHELIDAVHRLDMRIILDFVANHAAQDHEYSRLLQAKNTRSPENWSDISDFDFALPETRQYLAENMLYWVSEYGIDGYRCDVAGLVPDDFWQGVTGRLFRLRPDLFLLAEWQRPLLQQNYFHAGYDWVLYLILKDIRNKRRHPGDIIRWELERAEIYPQDTLLLRFTENHDLPRTSATFGSEAALLYGGLPFCLNGLPLIYAGQEWGIDHLPELFEKDPVPWHKGDKGVYDFYRRLIRIRQEHQALSAGSIDQISRAADDILVFRKYHDQEDLIVVANFGGRKSAALPDKCEGPYRDLISGARFSSGRMVLDGHRLYILIAD